jgi:hypothetical protein
MAQQDKILACGPWFAALDLALKFVPHRAPWHQLRFGQPPRGGPPCHHHTG